MHGLDYFCKINKISLTELSNYLGIAKTTPTSWKNGSKNFPDKYKLEIAKLFQIPDDKLYLLCIKEIDEVDKIEIELILVNKMLNDPSVDIINKTFLITKETLEKNLALSKQILRLEIKLKSLLLDDKFDEFDTKLEEIKKFIENME